MKYDTIERKATYTNRKEKKKGRTYEVRHPLYVNGNTVYGIDEDCMRRKQKMRENEQENYLTVLLCASLISEIEEQTNS